MEKRMGLGLGRRAGLALLLLLVAVAGVPGIRALRLEPSSLLIYLSTKSQNKLDSRTVVCLIFELFHERLHV